MEILQLALGQKKRNLHLRSRRLCWNEFFIHLHLLEVDVCLLEMGCALPSDDFFHIYSFYLYFSLKFLYKTFNVNLLLFVCYYYILATTSCP